MRKTTLPAALLLASAAQARPIDPSFTWSPASRVIVGEERQTHDDADAQRALTAGPAWQGFLARHPGRWQVRWDEATGTPIRIWGEGFPVDAGALRTDAGAFGIARSILESEAALLGGVALRNVHPLAVDRKQGIITVTFQQRVAGIAVEHARISLRFKNGRFVVGQWEAVPMPGITTSPRLSAPDAIVAALGALDLRLPDVEVGEPELVILPSRRRGGAEAHLAWRVPLRRTDRPSAPILWMDAQDGRLLGSEERVRFASGTLMGEVDIRTPGWGLTQAPLAALDLDVGNGNATTDGAGAFTGGSPAPTSVSLDLTSDPFDIDSSDGQDLEWTLDLSADGASLLVAPDPSDSAGAQSRTRSAIDVWRFATIVRDRALVIDPGFSWASDQLDIHVNLDEGGCNAWFDENFDLNFLRADNGCENTGRIADVVQHEYGHGFHIYSIIPGAGDWGDGSIGEGLSDYMSATINDSPDLAPGFFGDPNQPLRDLSPNARWPDDINGDIHITGLIIGGALWDLREALRTEMGDDAGVAHADQLFLAVAARAADIPDSYVEVLLADDDNGNLADGTPHQCAIDETFALHGLATGDAASGFGFQHAPPTAVAAQTPVTLDATGVITNPQCNDGSVGGIRILWSADPEAPTGSWEWEDLEELGGGSFRVELPPQDGGSWVRYRLEMLDENGSVVAILPSSSVTDPWFGLWVGEVQEVVAWDFEGDDGGFTHELVWAQEPREGSDDWAWDEARGAGGDPTEAASGSRLWGNDTQPQDNWNGLYQANVHNALTSPVIEVPNDRPVHLQFHRWLQVEDGTYDHARVLVDGVEIWSNFVGGGNNDFHHQDWQWLWRSYDIRDQAEDGAVQIRWELESDGGLEFGGWNVDDVRIIAESMNHGDDDDTTTGDDDDDTTPAGDDDTAATGDDDSTPLGMESLSGNGGCTCRTGASNSVTGLGLLVLLAMRRRSSPRATL